MPTGYTAKLVEKGQSFEEFVWTCARAFGALIMMRDDASDAPIPEAFKPSDYHVEQLAKAKARLAELDGMSEAERLAFGEREKMETVKDRRESLERSAAENGRIDWMLAVVREWKPPSGEHEGMKKFMIEQLTISRNDLKWSESSLEKAQATTPLDYYNNAVASAHRDLSYCPAELEKERARIAGRNKWLADLRASVPIPAHMVAGD